MDNRRRAKLWKVTAFGTGHGDSGHLPSKAKGPRKVALHCVGELRNRVAKD